jgi:hypothetical protein
MAEQRIAFGEFLTTQRKNSKIQKNTIFANVKKVK